MLNGPESKTLLKSTTGICVHSFLLLGFLETPGEALSLTLSHIRLVALRKVGSYTCLPREEDIWKDP